MKMGRPPVRYRSTRSRTSSLRYYLKQLRPEEFVKSQVFE